MRVLSPIRSQASCSFDGHPLLESLFSEVGKNRIGEACEYVEPVSVNARRSYWSRRCCLSAGTRRNRVRHTRRGQRPNELASLNHLVAPQYGIQASTAADNNRLALS